jgi:hypothetical protein
MILIPILLTSACGVLIGCGAPAVETASEAYGSPSATPVTAGPAPTGATTAPVPTTPKAPGKSGSTPPPMYGPAGEAGCSWGVSGAVEAWVDPSTSWAWVWPGGSLSCSGSAAGIGQDLNLGLAGLNGPGHYSSAGNGWYDRTWCASGETDCATDSFAAPKGSVVCEADITTAPATFEVGAKVAGTFSCTTLADAANPERTVTIYDGSFWAEMTPPPE